MTENSKVSKDLIPVVGCDIFQQDDGSYLYVTIPYTPDVIDDDNVRTKLN